MTFKNDFSPEEVGNFCYGLAQTLFPICRSLSGPGVRETLDIIKSHITELDIHAIPSGTEVFDWTVPPEWFIYEAYIENENGERIVDFQTNNLHVVGYSEPVDAWLSLDDLNKHLYSLKDQPNAIPYITSYYSRRWGFCLTHEQRESLKEGKYHAVIKSEIKNGVLNYADIIIPGDSKEEVFLSTYVCHPSMANNELSGPVVTTALVKWIQSLPHRKYTYRIVFIPETIGSIIYLGQHLETLKANVVAGFNVTCIGDDRCYSFLPSRNGESISDQAAQHTLHHIDPDFKKYSWLDRGSDERQYCSPGVDLPIATIMRSKYGMYPEYHTSLDDMTLITPSGLAGGFTAIARAINIIENNHRFKVTTFCEPQLGKRGLYPTLSTKESGAKVRTMMNLISYCDGQRTLLEIAELIHEPFERLLDILGPLLDNGLIVKLD